MGAAAGGGGLASGGSTGLGATLATGGENQVNDQLLKASGVQNGLEGITGKLGNEFSSSLGAGIDKPQLANVQQVVSPDQLQQGQSGVNNSLQSQQNLLAALQAQNGIGMQNTAGNNQLGLANQLKGANGVGVQQGAISGLQNTAGMYQNIANGKGPNPAQAMLNQATGQNVANQAALMAGQRGAGSNIGLMARQAGQQGAATQQQAVGQGATMQANQSLNALSGLTNAQQAIGGMGSNLTNQQAGANQAYANQANQVAGQQIGATTANTQANLANQQQLMGAAGAQNTANVQSQGSVNAGNAGLLNTGMQGKQAIAGGLMQGISGAAGLAGGGMVRHFDQGGAVDSVQVSGPTQPAGPSSSFGQFLKGWTQKGNSPLDPVSTPNANFSAGTNALQSGTAKGITSAFKKKPLKGNAVATGDIDSGPSEEVSSPDQSIGPNTGGSGPIMSAKGGLARGGGHVKPKTPAQKAVKKGDSYANDKVPAMLSAGEIVLPRSVTQSKDPVGAASKFVAQVLAKKKVGR